MFPASLVDTTIVIGVCLTMLQTGMSAKVTFPETPGSAPAAIPPASAAAAESRLLADAAGGFGLSSDVRSPSSRNLGIDSILPRRRPDCPLCDPSVYSYCGDKLLHDACCCLQGVQQLPYQCELADCSFIHAKSCREHGLITRCCCDQRLF